MELIFIAIFLVWVYIYLWNYSITNYKFNKKQSFQTIILIIFFLPIELFFLISIGLINLILSILGYFIIPLNFIFGTTSNIFLKARNGVNSVVSDGYSNYNECVAIIDIFNKHDSNNNYYMVKNINLVVNYFVSMIRCGVSAQLFEEKMNDFIYKYNNGIDVLSWIAQDDFI